MLLPAATQAQTSRIALLQSARNLEITTNGQTSSHLVTSNESVRLHVKNGQIIHGRDTMDMASTTLRLKTPARFAIDEDSTAFGKQGADHGLLAFRRSMNVGRWNSLVVPFSLTGRQVTDAFGEDCQLAALTAITATGDSPAVEFQLVDLQTDNVVLTANQHYLIKPSREPDIAENSQTSVVYGSGKVAGPVYAIPGVSMESGQTPRYQSLRSDDKTVTLRIRGYYYIQEVSPGTKPRYVMNDEGRITALTEPILQKGFRSYFEDGSSEEHEQLRFYIDGIGENLNDVTGLSETVRADRGRNEAFYDLQGRRVAHPSKGIYIIDGKKVIVK